MVPLLEAELEDVAFLGLGGFRDELMVLDADLDGLGEGRDGEEGESSGEVAHLDGRWG